ncbi:MULTISPECIES: metallophosphoesterase [unclassified Solwaraspora]|uniref:metallophosphoesterase n=1 Tax=unclassified Solwaraspora TaxID=2627926 RepID=UPI00259B7286|nr:metallophosphoesterase [Solwaraspora sp. WMMA2056]WJK42042.1 metallophosphoesterase [Solwaraspora sp. WMMA2056]
MTDSRLPDVDDPTGTAPPDSPTGPGQTGTGSVDPTGDRRPRPRSLDPSELGFTPRPPVPWLAPMLLLSTGLRTVLAMLFGAYLDKRELQGALPDDVHQHDAVDGELWIDYVADLGDGFPATYSLAYLLAQPELAVDGAGRLRRGDLLVMGGDQVYPSASGEAYEDRCKGPYQAALPTTPAGQPPPTLYAIPGNHDWYDGLTAFLRLFARRRDASIGGWRTEQKRSYFAARLPHNWWLFAIDEQFGAYLDDPQLIYFEKAAEQLGPDDRIILAVPEPTWVKAVVDHQAYDAVDYFLRTVIKPTGARVPLMISGDQHHYARYAHPERELITCGGGGAYLSATHKLPERITVPPVDTITRNTSPRRQYALAGRYPQADRSRRYSWGIFHRLPRRNPGFATLLGTLQTLLMLAVAGVIVSWADTNGQRLFSIPLVAMVVLTLGASVVFAKPPSASGVRHSRHWLLGLGHGAAHIALAWVGALIWLQLPFVDWPWPLPVVAAAVVYGPVAGLVASQLTAGYLVLAGAFDVNVNELFAGQGIEDSKSFVRMRITADGALTIYPMAVDRVCRRWRADPAGAPHDPWIVPEQPLTARLAEEPITVR